MTFFLHGKTRIWLLIGALLVAVVLAILLPLALLHANQQKTSSATPVSGTAVIRPQNFAVGANAQLSIKEQSGDISVYPSSTNLITIEPKQHGTSVAPNAQDVRILYNRTQTAQGNDQIDVSTDPLFGYTDFYITIPDTTSLQITVDSGSIDIHSGHGITVDSGSGNISLENIQGLTSVKTNSGDVTVNHITGPLKIEDQNGSISMQQIRGQVNVTTGSGNITASDVAISGQSLLQTQSGSIQFSGSIDPHGTYNLQTTDGNIDLVLPGNAAFSLDASTGVGTIQNVFGGNVVGGTPRARISLHTQYGSIAITKAL